ncbi:MAG: four helix bundle protein [Prevotella sp.]|nr:four helix bundle protein [Prevotella sp.]MBR3480506.1 four helix bundle protein [Prevotella sp.]
MTELELKERFRAFSIRIVKMVDAMPNTISSVAIAKQVVRSGTSPYANYRAACLGKSDKDFLNKLEMVEEELDETGQWLDIIISTEMLPQPRIQPLYEESQELQKIIAKSILTMKRKLGEYPPLPAK